MGRVCTCNCAAAVRAGELRKRMLHLASATMKGFTCSVAVSFSPGHNFLEFDTERPVLKIQM